MDYKVISFYRYVQIENPEQLRDSIREFCNAQNILGRILVGSEGINGACSGSVEKIERFKVWVKGNPLFENLTFREQDSSESTYHKLVCRIRNEVCVLGIEPDLSNKGVHVKPSQLKEWLDNREEIVLLDARNDYEATVGKFKGALTLPIKSFREFPDYMKTRDDLKDKKIVMYCTGGVRCEKSSAFLKENGFKDVYQLEGGIINYVNQFPDTYYEGSLYVFDDRLVSQVSSNLISECSLCGADTDQYINCHNLDCDTLFVCCKACQDKLNKTCSEDCMKAPRQRESKTNEQNLNVIGKVLNYYVKPSIALIEITEGEITKDDLISIVGKTTPKFDISISYLRDYEGNEIGSAQVGQLVTLQVSQKVRKNDMVVL